MKEEKIHLLIKESLLETSEDFTDNLMDKIELKRAFVKIPKRSKIALFLSFALLFAIPIFWHLLFIGHEIFSVLFYTPVIFLILLAINKYINLRKGAMTNQYKQKAILPQSR